MVGRTRYSLPLSPSLDQKFDALSAELDVRVLASHAGGSGADPRFVLVRRVWPRALDGPAFYALLPFRVARELRAFEPDAVLAQGAQEAALVLLGAAAGSRADPGYRRHPRRSRRARRGCTARRCERRSRRLPTRSLGAGCAARTACGRSRRTHPVSCDRPVSSRPPSSRRSWISSLSSRPPPRRCRSDRSHSSSACSSATRPSTCSPRRGGSWPNARRKRACTSSVAARSARWRPSSLPISPAGCAGAESLSTEEVARAIDEASVLVLPSRSEGLGRVVVEAFCRGRGVVASRVGGIPDIVVDGESGILVPPGDAGALADALVQVLSDRHLAQRLGATARASVESWLASPEEYAREVRELVETVCA